MIGSRSSCLPIFRIESGNFKQLQFLLDYQRSRGLGFKSESLPLSVFGMISLFLNTFKTFCYDLGVWKPVPITARQIAGILTNVKYVSKKYWMELTYFVIFYLF